MRNLRTLALFILLALAVTICGCQKTAGPEGTLPVKQGLMEENGYTYFYNEDGSLFTGGFKGISTEEGIVYYYFLPNGRAFSTGYKAVEIEGLSYGYFFEEDGKAFAGGLKEVAIGDSTDTYYFGADGRAVSSCWETIDGTQYYFDEKGRAVRNRFQAIGGNLYYFDDQFSPVTGGWFCLEEEQVWCYADESGILATDTVIEGYKLNAEGKCSTKYRIRELVAQYTNDSMTQQEKIDALYNWVLENDMTYIRTYEHVRADWVWVDSWVDDMAANLMDNWGGNCFRYGALMGMLIREATDLPVSVAIGETIALAGGYTPHCWAVVCQDDIWYVYDVEMQKFTETPDYNCYKIPADDSFLHESPSLTLLYSE